MMKYLAQPHINKLVNDPEQNFLSNEDTDSLRAVMRIADEFYQFLLTQEGDGFPPFDTAEFIVGTLRSGFDCFFDVHFGAHLAHVRLEHRVIESNLQNFAAFKTYYHNVFQSLLQINISFSQMYSDLILLCGLQFIFVGLVI